LSVTTNLPYKRYDGNGSAPTFLFKSRVDSASELRITRVIVATGVPKLWTDGVDYNATGFGSAGTVITITPTTLLPSTEAIIIYTSLDLLQQNDYVDLDQFPADRFEDDLDKRALETQSLKREVDQGIKIPIEDLGKSTVELPGAVDRASKALTFDSSGDPQASTLSAADLANNALNVVFDPSGTGAVATTSEAKHRESVSVADFGAVGGSATTDTAGFIAAIAHIDSVGGGILLVPKTSSNYILNESTFLCSNLHMIMDAGVVIDANTGFGANGKMFKMDDTNNVTIDGYGAAIKMTTYVGSSDQRHCIDIRGASNVTINGLDCSDAGGDGFYIGSSVANAFCTNIIFRDVKGDNNNRQGMSIVSVKGIKVINAKFTNTGGTSPAAGIDIEPNDNTHFIEDVVIDNAHTEGNAGNGIVVALNKLSGATDKHVTITINDHYSLNDLNAIEIEKTFLDGDTMSGRITINDAVADTPNRTCFRVRNYDALAPRVDFNNPTAINPNEDNQTTTKDYSGYVVFRESADTGATNVGNIHFNRPTCIDNRATTRVRDWFHMHTETGADLRNCSVNDPLTIFGTQQAVLLRVSGEVSVSDKHDLLVKQMNNANYAALPNQYFRSFTTEGTAMSGTRDLTLDISYAIGSELTLTHTDTGGFTVRLDPDSLSKIEPGSNGVGKNMSTTEAGATITFKRMSPTLWFITNEVGTWTREA